jgi:uncharacterized protein RhaS with RHS repeats
MTQNNQLLKFLVIRRLIAYIIVLKYLQKVIETTDVLGRTIAYNYDNMPTSITKSRVTATFVYDYSGQRIKKTVSSVTTVYIGKLYECTGGVCTKYVFAGSSRIASKKQSTVYYYHTDHLGSSSVITDSAGNKN